MKKYKKYVVIGFITFLIVIISFLYFNRKKEIPLIVPFDKNYLKEELKIDQENFNKEDKGDPVISVKDNYIKVSLEVLNNNYETEIKEGTSVFDLMKILQEKSTDKKSFKFKYKEHLGLGTFVNEINGLKGGDGGYWIYYVNNIKANIGVSNYKVKNGDTISWKYEESY